MTVGCLTLTLRDGQRLVTGHSIINSCMYKVYTKFDYLTIKISYLNFQIFICLQLTKSL